jgi:hypothetical protein
MIRLIFSIIIFVFPFPGMNPSTCVNPGFIRVDANGRYFTFDSGKSYIPVGFNKFMLYVEEEPEIDSLLHLWSNYGVNYLRVWVGGASEPEIHIGQFDEKRLKKLDYIIRKCEENNIYLTICFWDENTLRSGWSSGWDSGKNVYNLQTDSLGTTSDADDLKGIEHRPSWKAMKNRYEVFVKRWMNEKSIMMWDLVNDSRKTAVWKSEMYNFVRTLDENKHIITFQYNTGRNPGGEMDCGSVRVYDYNPEGNDPEEMAKSLFARILEALSYGDPVYCGEGRMHYAQASSYALERGFLHTLWGPIAVGAAGNLHSWLCDTKEGRWPDPSLLELEWMKGFSDFCQAINWNDFNSRNLNNQVIPANDKVKAFACGDEDEMLLYLMHDDPEHAFRTINTTLKISADLLDLPLKLEWIDIRTAQVIGTTQLESLPREITVPAFSDGIFGHVKK